MRFHRWRYGILALAVFLALPVMAVAGETKCGSGDAAKTYNSAKQICLKWFSPEDGTRVYKVFTLPATKSVCPDELECVLVDGKTEVTLKSCGHLEQSEVTFEDNQFFVTKFPQAAVYCFEDNTQKQRIYKAPEKENFCKLASSSYVDKRWSKVFLPYKKDKKAEPWNDLNMSYCPDPLKHSKAYDLAASSVKTITADIVRRQLLETCSIVVQEYKKVCEEKRADISGEIGVQNQNKEQGKEKKKRELIAEWVSAKDCIVGENLGGNCLKQWNCIKGLESDSLAIKSVAFPIRPKYAETKGFVLRDAPACVLNNIKEFQKVIINQMKGNNEEIEGNKKWTSGTLDAFLTAQAESAFDPKTINTNITGENTELLNVGEVISFLQKRVNNIALSNSLSATKTFNVTSLLRRNTGSIESQLTLLGEEKFDTNGNSLNIFNKIIRLVAQVLGSLGVLLLIVSAVMMVVSQGEETMLQKAKQTFLYTIIGLVIAFFSYTIVRFLLELLLLR